MAGARDRALVAWFNAVANGEVRRRLEGREQPDTENPSRTPGATALPRKPDMLFPPAFDETTYLENLASTGLDVGALKSRGLYPERSAKSSAGNSDAMTGTIAISIFFVESDGSGTDPDQ